MLLPRPPPLALALPVPVPVPPLLRQLQRRRGTPRLHPAVEGRPPITFEVTLPFTDECAFVVVVFCC